MNKLDRNIISSINDKKSNEEVTYENGGFFSLNKGVKRNFAVLVDDIYLFVRIDPNAYPLSKRIFKNFEHLKEDYIVCLGTDRTSRFMIQKGYDVDDFEKEIPDLFGHYSKHLMKIFDKKNIDFKELFYNTLDYFGSLEYFVEVVNDKKFWGFVESRYNYSINFMSNKYDLKMNDLEKKELNKSDWVYSTMEKQRSYLIDQILN